MMKTDKEYEQAKQQLSTLMELHKTQITALTGKGLTDEQAKDSLSSSWTYAMQCKEEIELYERLKAGALPPLDHFSSKGKYFVAARIAKGMTQRQLAEKLGVKESAVSRDERNEYHGMSVEKMERLATALDLKVLISA
ncbi:MAG: helix-turn-helix domain-containing protein [Candidatus Obscuribacterales bacterium]|nr:helix-turn-helix domain-containing protein [Candidatus Obscuribacterales bacterium]